MGQRSSTQPSPLLVSSFFQPTQITHYQKGPVRQQASIETAPNTSGRVGAPFMGRRESVSFSQGFKFPAVTSPSADARAMENFNMDGFQNGSRLLSPRSKETIPMISEQTAPPVARVLSPTSIAGTPRSSGEFYSLSNNSTETLASEYTQQQPGRMPSYGHTRRPSNFGSVNHHRPPETLMMGYAQIHGSFA